MKEQEPSYQDLKMERLREWGDTQRAVADRLHKRALQLADMPDVKSAPSIGSDYAHDVIMCPCQGTRFRVEHWVWISGINHRARLRCLTCDTSRWWDWRTQTWVA